MAIRNSRYNNQSPFLYMIIMLLVVFLIIIVPFSNIRFSNPSPPSQPSPSYSSPPLMEYGINTRLERPDISDPYSPPTFDYPMTFKNDSPSCGQGCGGGGCGGGGCGGQGCRGCGGQGCGGQGCGRLVVPVNIKTQGIPSEYTQVGILTRSQNNGADGEMILPLMGRLNQRNRQRWQYYTLANGVGSIHNKLPITVRNRSCTSENGCEEISSGDSVYVQGYKQSFMATVYENNTMEYLPL